MLIYDMTLKCGQWSTQRLTWMRDTICQLNFHIVDKDGTPLDTRESWGGRVAQAWVGGVRIFYTNDPQHLHTQQAISSDTVVKMEFGDDKWDLQLIASDTPISGKDVANELPDELTCVTLAAQTHLSAGDIVYADRISTNKLQVFEQGDQARAGWIEAPNIDVKQIFIDEGLKNTGLTILRGTTELDAGEVTTCGMPTIVNMTGARIVINGDTRVYCPLSPKDGGDVYYDVVPTWSQEFGGYVLLLMRHTD